MKNACFSSSLFFNLPLVAAVNFMHCLLAESDDSNSRLRLSANSLIQLGNISKSLALSSMLLDMRFEPCSKALPYLYLFGFISMTIGCLSLLKPSRISLQNFHIYSFIYLPFAAFYTISACILYNGFTEMSAYASI